MPFVFDAETAVVALNFVKESVLVVGSAIGIWKSIKPNEKKSGNTYNTYIDQRKIYTGKISDDNVLPITPISTKKPSPKKIHQIKSEKKLKKS